MVHRRSLCPKEKNFHRTKLAHRQSMSEDRQLFQGQVLWVDHYLKRSEITNGQ